MTLKQADNGNWYGTDVVLLTRIVKGETETLVGSRAPFGACVLVEERFEGKRFREEWSGWWEERGFTITESPTLQMARAAWRSSRDD